jgi:hypothetical protein
MQRSLEFYGNDAVNCDSCGRMFDPHSETCEWMDIGDYRVPQPKLVCSVCFHGYTDDELTERLE